MEKINDEVVKPIKIGSGKRLPVKGAGISEEPYSNIFLLAKKKSGKSTLINHMLNKFVGRDTRLVFIVSTAHKDDVYKQMISKWSVNHDVAVYANLREGKHSIIELELEDPNPEADPARAEKKAIDLIASKFMSFDDDSQPELPVKREKRKLKYLAPEVIFILDDQGSLMRDSSVSNLLKKNRHYKSKVIISSQYLTDLQPAALKQLDIMIIFGSQPGDKLERIHMQLDLSLPIETFKERYKEATAKRFNFLYIDTVNERYRRNLNMEFKD